MVLAQYVNGEVVDELVAPAGGHPQQVGTVAQVEFLQGLQFGFGQQLQPGHQFFADACGGGVGAHLQQLVLAHLVARFLPITMSEIAGDDDRSLGHEKPTGGEGKPVGCGHAANALSER